ncbi:uncharacterized protein BO80DRAFT_279371 [Aspergillus ibericus CBS 121593]|uniref:Uncharacterized protein n=1 Tax=Aspergillus ibericus CBS 121593 TaxID=1448316 RepID=A0A395GM66_9EURO|nr:hypothetical protein BO80DRAFT_279371 [Aspergillus ibericus CBS 121593]RAK95113.1 hypothetical protein BO80DRAFT_279371 [Aspergillus ibericus CBS 121593]
MARESQEADHREHATSPLDGSRSLGGSSDLGTRTWDGSRGPIVPTGGTRILGSLVRGATAGHRHHSDSCCNWQSGDHLGSNITPSDPREVLARGRGGFGYDGQHRHQPVRSHLHCEP